MNLNGRKERRASCTADQGRRSRQGIRGLHILAEGKEGEAKQVNEVHKRSRIWLQLDQLPVGTATGGRGRSHGIFAARSPIACA
eukprot:1830137-Rhodomonas_salina.2